MTKIIVNASFLSQPLTGVQRFGIEISRCLKKIYCDQLIVVSPSKIVQKDIALELEAITYGHLTGALWEQLELPFFLLKYSGALLLNFGSGAPLLYFNKVSTVHDITFLRYPNTFTRKNYLLHKYIVPLVIKTSKKIITVSEFSKKEIIDTYKCSPKKCIVVYNAVTSLFEYKKERRNSSFLVVSSIKENKNIKRIINAFNMLNSKYPEVKLVVIGDLSATNFKKVETDSENKNIKFVGRIPDIELWRYYSESFCFLFPSLYEGFGIPVIEAQSCGTPVIASNISSLPEICGDSVLYCNPYSIEDIASKMEQIINNAELHDDLSRKGFQNTSRFSWRKSAEVVVRIINSL